MLGPSNSSKPIVQASSAFVGMLLLGGCSTLDNVTDRASAAASSVISNVSQNDFNNRVYASASAGAARLNPDTQGTQFTFSSRTGGSTQLRLGADLHSLVSVELDSSILGAAAVREVDADVRYTSITSSAVFYGLGNSSARARRVGWQGYGRLGASFVQTSSIVQPFDGSNTGLLIGAGAEYGFRNGLAIRGEVTRFDDEATLFGLGVVYRLGLSPRKFGSVVANVAKDAVPSDETLVGNSFGEPALGAARPDTVLAPGHESLVSRGPHAALWSEPKLDNDVDGDGVPDGVDICDKTRRNAAVNQVGCGLFDSVLSEVTFKRSSHWVSEKSRQALDDVVDVLLAFPEARVEVQAHADDRGPEELNKHVSTARAEAVVKYMLSQGVGEKQLVAMGYGESQPIASNSTAEGRRKNRRIQLLTLPSLTPQEISDQQPGYATAATNPNITPVKPEKTAAEITIDKEKFHALAKIAAGYDGARTNSSSASSTDAVIEPSLAAALPNNEPSVWEIEPAVYISRLGLGGSLKGVSFNSGTDTLKDSSKSELNQVSEKLKLHKNIKVALLVHVNEPEDEATNLALSRAQATTLIDYIESQGVDRSRLIAEPYGDALPVAQTINESDRVRNRRVELRVVNP